MPNPNELERQRVSEAYWAHKRAERLEEERRRQRLFSRPAIPADEPTVVDAVREAGE